MKKQCFCTLSLAGLSLTEFGLKIPSPFCSLELTNSEITSYTNWSLNITVGGNSEQHMNVAAFEALIYSAAQTEGYANASGIPVNFMFGWLKDDGSVESYVSYQGYTLTYKVSTSNQFMSYVLTGYASQAVKASMPVLNIPALTGFVQPSAVVEALAKAVKATSYYTLDIDHSDAPTYISHNAMSTSFVSYVRGDRSLEDDYDTFPGLLTLSKSYNASRDAGSLKHGSGKLNSLLNNLTITPLSSYLKKSITDNTPQCGSFSFWIDEPTMTHPGVIHYKNSQSISVSENSASLQYGTANTNILTFSGEFNGVAYNISDMNFSTVGFTLDEKGSTIIQDTRVTNSWSNSLADVYQSANIINDINALATQFSGSFSVIIPGSTSGYSLCQPVSLIVMSGNTLSPISGVYSVTSVTQSISSTFLTTLKLTRLAISSANQTAASLGIYESGSAIGRVSSFTKTPNVKSTGKVDFGTLYPTFEDIEV